MKTINQVLLALLFVAFSTVGFAQSQTTLPVSTVKLNDDIRFEDYTDDKDDDDEDDDRNDFNTDIEYVEARFSALDQKSNSLCNSNYSIWMPNRD
jgi:hypothetical protein